MEKDWTASAMPSVLKGLALIGQPIPADEFEKAFGYKMPDIKLSEDEKRRAGIPIGQEPAIRAEENPPATETEKKPETSFGQHVMTLIQQGNTAQPKQQKYPQPDPQQDSQDPPLQIDIRGVGSSQPDEQKENSTGNPAGKTNKPVITETSGSPKKQNEAANSALLHNLLDNGQEKNPLQTLKLYNPTTYPQEKETRLFTINEQNLAPQTGTGETVKLALNHFLQMGENENADNIAAQKDPNGQHQNAHETIRQGINRFAKEFVEKSTNLTRQQQETGEQNHLLNWTADVARDALKNPVTHSRQDYQPGYQAILGHDANRKLAEAAAEGIETDVNGKEKYQIVKDAFQNRYITEPGKLGIAIVSLADHALATLNRNKPINPSITQNVDNRLFDLIGQSENWLKNSIPLEKLNKAIVAGDDAKTIENLTQFGYELMGENGPYTAANILGAPLLAGAAATGAGMSGYKLVKDYTVNLAEANASIVKETGTPNWELAFKIASLKIVGGRAIDGQMKSLIKTGGKGGVFIEQLGDAIKKRFNSMVDGFYFNKDKRKDDENPK